MNKTQQLKKKISEYVGLECRVCDGRKMLMSERCHSCDGSGEAEITLEDVLIALEEKDLDLMQAKLKEKGSLIKQELADLLTYWEWGKPLENQSEETKQFLFEILCQ